MCHQIPNITLHAFRCSESILRYFVICPKRKSMHHIPHTDLHFSSRTCRANPAGTVFLNVFWCTTLCFCKNFTHRALLKRNYWNVLMVLSKIGAKLSASTKNARISWKMARFCKICVTESQISHIMRSAVQNSNFELVSAGTLFDQCMPQMTPQVRIRQVSCVIPGSTPSRLPAEQHSQKRTSD